MMIIIVIIATIITMIIKKYTSPDIDRIRLFCKVVPPSYKLVYNPNKYRYNPLINPSEIVLINQLS